MPDKDTVSPYGDDVVDPYSADDTKNPHEPAAGGAAPTDEEAPDPAPRKATRTSKTAKKT